MNCILARLSADGFQGECFGQHWERVGRMVDGG